MIFESCALVTPRDEFYIGMRESLFLRRNKDAVISELNATQTVYRLQRSDRFYALITFVDEELTNVEEREITNVSPWPADSTRQVNWALAKRQKLF